MQLRLEHRQVLEHFVSELDRILRINPMQLALKAKCFHEEVKGLFLFCVHHFVYFV